MALLYVQAKEIKSKITGAAFLAAPVIFMCASQKTKVSAARVIIEHDVCIFGVDHAVLGLFAQTLIVIGFRRSFEVLIADFL